MAAQPHGRELFLRAAAANRQRADDILRRMPHKHPEARPPMQRYADKLLREAEEYERLAEQSAGDTQNPQRSRRGKIVWIAADADGRPLCHFLFDSKKEATTAARKAEIGGGPLFADRPHPFRAVAALQAQFAYNPARGRQAMSKFYYVGSLWHEYNEPFATVVATTRRRVEDALDGLYYEELDALRDEAAQEDMGEPEDDIASSGTTRESAKFVRENVLDSSQWEELQRDGYIVV